MSLKAAGEHNRWVVFVIRFALTHTIHCESKGGVEVFGQLIRRQADDTFPNDASSVELRVTGHFLKTRAVFKGPVSDI